MFAGLAGALDITGWEYRLGELDIPINQIGFIGLAAALLGRNTAVGVGFASLLFGALINGTSGRQLDPSVFRPDLAGNLTTIIQGLVVLFVGLNLTSLVARSSAPEAGRMTAVTARARPIRLAGPEDRRHRRDRPRGARVLARPAAAHSAAPRPVDPRRDPRHLRRHLDDRPRRQADRLRRGRRGSRRDLLRRARHVLVDRAPRAPSWSGARDLGDAALRDPAHVRRDRRPLLRARAASSTSRSTGCC